MTWKKFAGLAITALAVACADGNPPAGGGDQDTGVEDVGEDVTGDAVDTDAATDGSTKDIVMPDGNVDDVTTPDVTTPDGSVDDTVTTDVVTPDGTVDDVTAPDGSTMDGATTDGATPDGATMDGATMDGTTTDVATMDGTTTDIVTPDVVTPDGTTPDAMACAAPFSMCGAACVDTQTDTMNCGRCGTVCTAGQVCTAGACTTTCATGETLCTTGGGPVCTNTNTDGTNCGRCGTVCPSGQSCVAGVCTMGCAMGTTACTTGGTRSCVDLQADPANCGSCGNVCPTGRVCTAGACACAGAATLCGSACVNTNTDAMNCGRCGNACATGTACSMGVCGCPMGQTSCGGRCVDAQTDTANCGSCGNACAMGATCTAGTCAAGGPTNDARSGATRIDLAQPAVSLSTDTTAARNDTSGSCACTSGRDVFYSFTLTASEIVYADTIGATWDTSLFLQNSAGTNLLDPMLSGGSVCNDDNGMGCSTGLQSMIAARLPAGTYYLVLSGCGAGAATIHFHHLPAGNGPVAQITPRGTVTLTGTTSGTGLISSTCCSGGPENTYYWVTCPDFTSTAFTATTCGGATGFDSELDQRSAARAGTVSTCNDDNCALLSLVTSTIPSGAGLHTLYLDSCSGSGAYNLSVTFGACPTGTSLCSGRCATVATDTSNCGRCGNVCPTGQVCSAGVCTVVCAAPTTRCGTSCVDLTNDNNNCGACGTACPTGQRCASGACGCAGSTSLCGSSCVDTTSDTANCGRCGNACAAGLLCVSGACRCPGTTTACGGACVDTTSDRTNCGTCGTACGAGQACTASRCTCTGAGLTACGASCVNLSTDNANCGACARACAAGTTCTAGVCVTVGPANDTRGGATPIALGAASVTLSADTTRAVNNTTGSCGCTGGNDVFYTFTLAQPEIVYADTIGATWDTSLFIQNAAGTNLTDPLLTGGAVCNDDGGLGCSIGTLSMIAARLPAGTYYLVLSGCGSGVASIHFQHLPVGNGAVRQLATTAGSQTVTGTTSGTGLINGACCDGGPEDTFYWLTCPTAASTSFTASSCGGATWDTDLDQRSAARTTGTVACNDDACAFQSSVTSTIPAGAGIHTFYVDGCGAGAGAYSVNVIFGSCPAGTTNCSTRCVNTATDSANCGACGTVCPAGQACSSGACACTGAGLTTCGATCVNAQTDNSNCGRCGNVCPSGQSCVAGACSLPGPANDTRAGAAVIAVASASSINLTADTTRARNNTSGSCGCTSGNDVFYSFTLAAPEIVYADTVGATWDTSLFIQNSAGTNLTDPLLTGGAVCNDDNGMGCSTGVQSMITARLAAGTYYLVLSGCGAGAATIHFHHLPVGNGAVSQLAAGTGATLSGTTSGTGLISGFCCDGGPENTYYWVSCPGYAGGTFSAQTCSRASWDTDLAQRSATRATPVACNDDSCGLQSSMSSTIPAGPGLHTFYVDGCGAGSGAYSVLYTRP